MNSDPNGLLSLLFLAALVSLIIVWNTMKKTIKRLMTERDKTVSSLGAELDDYRIKHDAATKEIANLRTELADYQSKYSRVSKYEGVADAEARARELIHEASIEADRLRTEAKNDLTKSRADAKAMRDKADEILREATLEAARIVDNARKQAVEIAGEAYEAMKDSQNFERTAKAMKNIIEGYGNEYIVPLYTLIDDLAEEFGYTEGGEELKKARARTRLMVQNGTAARCDYAEQNRKDTAIRFVLDAFNGKVDSILSEVKRENYGKLEQMIRDAFQTVNYNGTAFRNAAITDEYLASRLEELKYLAIVQELKVKEREEQRALKEQMREEEKARREYERAKKEAEKEADAVKKAMEKVETQLAAATEEQKAKYEAQLAELMAKLSEAEERNKRALSMAQQTKTGHIYVISNIGSFGEDVYKIGMTRRLEPLDRIKELGDASVPFEFDVHALILSDDAPALENRLHRKFMNAQVNKVNPKKEFFRLGISDIKTSIEEIGIEAKWTIAAEARQYRESQAIEERLRTDEASRKEWERMQNKYEAVYAEEDEEAGG